MKKIKILNIIVKIIAITLAIIFFTSYITPIKIYADEATENESTEDQNAEEESDEETEEDEEDEEEEENEIGGIDVTKCVEIVGDYENGYYIKFVDDLDEKLAEVYQKGENTYSSLGVNDLETFKKMVKAEIATEFPNMGGVVSSNDPISQGNEAPAGGNESVAIVTSGGSGEGSYEWPVSTQTTPQDRGQNVTSIKADRASPGGIGSTNHQGMDIQCSSGTPILATASGTVTIAGEYGGYGNAVVMTLDHPINGKTATVTYGHNTSVSVNVGDHVDKGQEIALSGSTGWSTRTTLPFSSKLRR